MTSYCAVNRSLAQALQKWRVGEEFVLYRGAFRWMNMDDEVMSNHYEGMSVESIAEEFGYEIVYSAEHAAIFRLKG